MTQDRDSNGRTSKLRELAEPTLADKAGDAVDVSTLSTEELQKLVNELRVHQIELEMQNEELQRAQEMVQCSEELLRKFFEISVNYCYMVSSDGVIFDVNASALKALGYERDELVGRSVATIYAPESRVRATEVFETWRRTGRVENEELVIHTKSGQRRTVLLNASAHKSDRGLLSVSVQTDITERKKAEERVRKEGVRANLLLGLYKKALDLGDKELYDYALDQAVQLTDSAIGFFHLVADDQKTVILTTWNSEALKNCTASYATHYSLEQAGNWVDCVRLKHPIIYNDFATSPNRKGLPEGHAPVRRFMSIPVMDGDDVRIIFGVGNKVEEYDDDDVRQIELVAGELQKVLKQRRSDAELRESEERFRVMADSSPVMLWISGSDGLCTFFSRGWLEFRGRSMEQEIGNGWQEGVHADDLGRCLGTYLSSFERRKDFRMEYRLKRYDGDFRWTLDTGVPRFGPNGEFMGYIGSCIDITERKGDEEALQRLNRELRAVSNCNQTMMRAENEQTLLDDICHIVCDVAGYRLAWVGYAENDDAKTVRPVACAGAEDGYVATANLTWADTERGRGPAGTAIRTGEIVYVQDFATDPRMALWRDNALQRGYRSGIALPLKDQDARVFGVLLIYSAEIHAITPEEIRLMEELAGDLAFGIVTLRTSAERRQAEERLRLLDFAVNHVREAAFLTDENGRFHFVNEESCRALGYTRSELLGLGVSDIDPDFPADPWLRHWNALKKQRSLVFESRHRAKDGRVFPVEVSANYFEYRGQGYNLALVHDITERKHSEQERLANLWFFESMDRVNRAIQGTNDLEQMMSDVLDVVLSIFDCDRSFLMYPCDPQAASWTSPMERTKPGYPGVLALGLKMPMDAEVAETLRILLESDGPVKFGPATGHGLPIGVSEAFGFKSFMAMALHPKLGKPWQFGIHDCSCPRVWTSEEERLFQEIGRRMSDALTSLLTYRNLQESEAKLTEAERIAHIGYWERDYDADSITLSAEAYRIFGLSPEEPFSNLAQWHERWLQLIHPEDRSSISVAAADAVRIGSVYEVEYRIVRPDGQVRAVHSFGEVTRDKSGRARRMIGSMQDITERKRADEQLIRLFTAVEHAGETIVVTDSAGTILYVNPAFENTTGYERQEVIGRNPRILQSGKQDRAFYQHMWDTLLSGQVWRGRFTNKRKDGTLYEETATISPIRDEGGRVANYVAVKRDVTGESLLQRQLIQAQKMEAIGTLAGGIAHDFNNLLQVINGYAEMALFRIKEGDAGYSALLEIRRAARSAAELTQGLLTFSRRVESKLRPVDLNQELQEVAKMLTRTLPKMIEIEMDLFEPLDTVNSDPAQLQQVVMNLAVNARDAMPNGGRLSISTKNVYFDEEYCKSYLELSPGNYVLLSISDSGTGMDEETRKHIFDPFFTTKETGKGTGLGLSIVFGIVKSHGGNIQCFSEPGHGTSFKIYLPALRKTHGVAETPQLAAYPGGNETILLVDDEESVRKLAASVLKRFGYTVLTASDGKECVEVFSREKDKIDLLILDLIMPEMDGSDCLKEILKIAPETKVVIASGYVADGQIDQAIEAGAKSFVTKPYDARQLLERVRKALDGT
jgi:PAS domain S-box-containing protein